MGQPLGCGPGSDTGRVSGHEVVSPDCEVVLFFPD